MEGRSAQKKGLELGIFVIAYQKRKGQVDKLATRRFWDKTEGFKLGAAGVALRDAIIANYKDHSKEFDWNAARSACQAEVTQLKGIDEHSKQEIIDNLGLDNIKKGYEYAIFHIAESEIKKGLEAQLEEANGYYKSETKELAGLELLASRRNDGKKKTEKKTTNSDKESKKKHLKRVFSFRKSKKIETEEGSDEVVENPHKSKLLKRFSSLRNVPTAELTTDDDDAEDLEVDLINARDRVASRNKMIATIKEKIEKLEESLKPIRDALKIDQFTEFSAEKESRLVQQQILSQMDLDELKSTEQKRKTRMQRHQSLPVKALEAIRRKLRSGSLAIPPEETNPPADDSSTDSETTEDELSESLIDQPEDVNKRYRILFKIATGNESDIEDVLKEYYGDEIEQYGLGALFKKEKTETPLATTYLFTDFDQPKKFKLQATVFKLFDYLLVLKKEQQARAAAHKNTRKKPPTAKIDGLVRLLQRFTTGTSDVDSLTTYVSDILAGESQHALLVNRGPHGMYRFGRFFHRKNRYNPVKEKKTLINSDTELRLCELYDELKTLQVKEQVQAPQTPVREVAM